MDKKIIRLTESDLRYLIKETVQIVLEGEVSDLISKFQSQVMELESQHNELYKQDNRLTNKINRLKKIMKDYPEEAHLHENELNEMIAQRDEIRKKKAEIRAQIKQLQNERNKKLSPRAMRQRAKDIKAGLEPLPSLPGRDVTPKSLWKKRTTSKIEARQIERNNWAEERYKEILTNGFLLVPKAKEATVMSDGRRRFVDLSNPFNKKFSIEKFKEFVGKNHPEKIVKSSLIPRKRERNQLDDVEYYDMKVFLEDNPDYKPNTPNPNTIQFSPEDVPTGKRSISFSPEDMPDYTY